MCCSAWNEKTGVYAQLPQKPHLVPWEDVLVQPLRQLLLGAWRDQHQQAAALGQHGGQVDRAGLSSHKHLHPEWEAGAAACNAACPVPSLPARFS